MRTAIVSVSLAVSALVAGQQADPSSTSVAKILANARLALGGEQRLQAITSFTAKGAMWQQKGHSRYPASFEIACELPDKFVRKIEKFNPAAPPGAEFLMTRRGFAGTLAIFEVQGHGAPTSADIALLHLTGDGRQLLTYGQLAFEALPPDAARRYATLAAAQQDFVEMTLAWFATSFPSVPLQFLDAPGTKDGTEITVKGQTSVVMRFDPKTGLPAALGALEFSRYRLINGMNVASRFVIPASGASSNVSEGWERGWEINEIRFNVTINPKVFATK